jgi:PKD repeat protein
MILCLVIPVHAYHIPNASEGLLDQEGCYVGAYLGGNQGANDALCVNFFRKAQPNPYETQYLDQPKIYGEKKGGGLAVIDTGILAFRKDLDLVQKGSGEKQVLFSRYYNMNFYPDNDYGKIPFVESEAPYVWAEKVIQQGGVPILAVDPYALVDGEGKIDLSVTSMKGKTGTAILEDLARNLKAVTEQYPDTEGKPATVIIWFAHEFNSAPSVNPEANDLIDSAHKKAFRRAFREAYAILHQYGGDGIQVAWAGNIAQTREDREHYWPGYDDEMNELPTDSVDWVGMTWYPWPDGPKTLDRFQGFYDFYARDRQHPFIFMETSADGWGDQALENSLKLNQVRYLYNSTTLSPYPNIKGIVWFNVVKAEQRSGSDLTRVTKNFLIPDGQWKNYGQSTTIPGDIQSATKPFQAMLQDYPAAMMDPYFIAPVAPTTGTPGAPAVDFSADKTAGDAPLTVQFTDLSEGKPVFWLYRFGDGTTSGSPNPRHTYRVPGKYAVNLTVWKLGGSGLVSASMEKPGCIMVTGSAVPALSAGFSAETVSGPAPLIVRFTDTTTGNPLVFAYTFGDGTRSDRPNPTHTYLRPGTYTVSLTVLAITEGRPVSDTAVQENLIVVI